MEEKETVKSMPDPAVNKGKKVKELIFGVYTLETGSLTLDEHRFKPFTVVAVPPEVRDLACEETSPVKFFGVDQKKADEFAANLRKKRDLKRNPQKAEEQE